MDVPILSVQLEVSGRTVLLRFYQFEECLRISSLDFEYKSKNGLLVKSYQYPELTDFAVWLPGLSKDQDHDFHILYTLYDTEKLMNHTIQAIGEFLEFLYHVKIEVVENPVGMFNFYIYNGRSKRFSEE